MSGLLQAFASLATAGVMLVSNSLNTAAPQNDIHGTLFLVNRQWRVSADYEPEDLRVVQVTGRKSMREEAAAAFEEMAAVCLQETGKQLTCVSGYRSYETQSNLYSNKLKRVKTQAKADEYVARPGASEHQLGMAMDVGQVQETSLVEAFGKTVGGKWIRENCWRFGFILRYGEGWEDVTGYKYEPWHVRYVGLETSTAIHDNAQPFETYLLDYRADTLMKILRRNAE